MRATLPAAALLAVALTGCTATVEGTASPAESAVPTTSAPPSTSEPAEPTEEPVDVTPAPAPGVGTLLEAHRIASVTALVQTSFPDRTESCFPSGPVVSAAAVDALYFGDGSTEEILDSWGFVAGWGQCNSSPASGFATLTLAVELSDPESAVRAAEELVEAQAGGGYEEVDVDGDGGVLLMEDGDTATVQAFAPVGRMLAYVYHQSATADAATDLDRVLGDQVQLLRGFTPTPQADVPSLPTDPVGLQALALDPPGELNNFSGPYDLEGYLRIAIDPAREREVLTANGFRGFYAKQSEEGDLLYAVALYAFPTSAETNTVYTTFSELETAAYGGTRFTLPSIPAAPCFWFQEGDSYYQRCYVGYGSYLASVDVLGLSAPEDVAAMDALLPAQRDLIDG
ncbi:DUF7373 family lipoprotein [Blastococcus sp. SYSU D00820]